ncbi:MAG: HipA domain-containing protein [Mogibacterium sp.]|nr:HipA domain-containing protein [Mogibacterium sp.]
MRKNDIVTICDLDEAGNMLAFSRNYRNPELAPLAYKGYEDSIQRWWRNRQIPLRQGRVEQMLRKKGFDEPSEYLLKNLGLSLVDYYWIRPIDTSLKWEDVNLFENDFKENIMEPISVKSSSRAESYTPNSSLKGELEKTWLIRKGRRVLIKGNHGRLSTESINEAFASEFHRAQGYDNFTEYRLIHIKEKAYDYACCCEAFTSSEVELVSAHDLLTSEKAKGDISEYERLIQIACRHGIDEDELRGDLEYQILSDYLLSNIDRHMDNIGFIRDAETLRLKRMAPIFDTGKAFGGSSVVPYTEEEIDNMEVNSFERSEKALLSLVNDKKRIKADRLPSEEKLRKLYARDSQMSTSQIDMIARLYEKKKERLEQL